MSKQVSLLLIFLFFFLGLFPTHAQGQNYRILSTQEVNDRLAQEDLAMQEMQDFINQQVAKLKKSRQDTLITIPVIIHVVYSGNEERLSLAQIESQIDALNRDFQGESWYLDHPADTLEGFADLVGDPEIEFCFANVTSSLDIQKGVRYIQSEKPYWTSKDSVKFSKYGGANPISPKQYLNIWVTRLKDEASGYAQMPGGPAKTDGIVVDYRFFGTEGTAQFPFDEGKTLTHLVGNYLGLNHLWGTSRCQDDLVEDTPIHNTANSGCPGYKHRSLCEGNPVEMTMNFMDNTNDACMRMFTKGQVERMRAMLAIPEARASLTTGTSICAEELPETDDELDFLPDLETNIYPNPGSGEIQIVISSNIDVPSTLSVFNPLGVLVYSAKVDLIKGSKQIHIDSSSWSDGIYYLKVDTKDELESKQFLISHQ